MAGQGGGSYRIKSSSPLLTVPARRFLPYDLEGNGRGLSDAPGAYSSANPRKAGGFW